MPEERKMSRILVPTLCIFVIACSDEGNQRRPESPPPGVWEETPDALEAVVPTAEIPHDPEEVTVVVPEVVRRQRTTEPLPGLSEEVLLTVGDVTRGQVMVSLASHDRRTLSGPVSLRPGASLPFETREGPLELVLDRLENHLVGTDHARFRVIGRPREAARPALSETAKIERLLEHVRRMDAVFLRNGEEHAPAEAERHLRRKWSWRSGEMKTAAEFIARIATRSSTTGDAYILRRADGTTQSLAEVLELELRRLEGSR